MKSISIKTAQNVNIDYKIADVGERIIATIIDWLIILGFYFLMMLFGVLFPWFHETFPILFTMIILIPVFFYNFILEYFMGGQTFGKRIRNIKIVKVDGSNVSAADHFIRWILRPIEIIFSSGAIALITAVINGKGQRLGDIAASTTVISLKSSVKLNRASAAPWCRPCCGPQGVPAAKPAGSAGRPAPGPGLPARSCNRAVGWHGQNPASPWPAATGHETRAAARRR